ncbi:MHS family proline/betaine transporter-like MFS transporter [Melghirimyces profundicolus]|uniref:Putative proline/betaine transporter n=2 Tax=Melghirimyces profundicolus TaxID=1242148 RepID=A0A2T6C7S0_9BACL|nr:MFS transporter [Melghirimyces profundicolus]PTX64371.1 MHS family proline/betaine transporter-like MFS transporter [Melghirimyces profundicolus]
MAEKGDNKKQRFSIKIKSKQRLEQEDVTVVDMEVAKKAVAATGLGNAMEWFDFGIYSYLAVTIGKVFFPEMTGGVQLIYTFATFAVAFLVRPLGGLFFGMLGDRLGRKKVLAMTLIVMAISTLSIGLIPSYTTIGSTATILLLIARLVQGFSTGGEYAGAMTFIAESTPDKKRGVMASGLEVGTLIGYIAGAGLVTLLTFILGSETMVNWGWRIPFLIAGPIGFIGFYLRNRLEETPAFEAMEEARNDRQHLSMKDIFISHWRTLLIGMIVVFFYNVVNYMVLSYMPSHLSAVLGYGETKGLLLVVIIMLIMVPIVIMMGYFGDRIGAKRIVQGGLIGLIFLSIPSFLLIASGNIWMVFLGLMMLAVFSSSFQGTMPSLLPSLFFTEVRYGALAITYNISASLFGGTTPLVVSWLINLTADRLVPAYYLVFASLIGIFVVTYFVKDTTGKSLRGSPPAVEEKQEIRDVLEKPEEALWWKEEKNKIDEP